MQQKTLSVRSREFPYTLSVQSREFLYTQCTIKHSLKLKDDFRFDSITQLKYMSEIFSKQGFERVQLTVTETDL